MTSPWASKVRTGKIILGIALAMHIGTYYLKPLLISDKNMLKSDNCEHKKQTKYDKWWEHTDWQLLIHCLHCVEFLKTLI